MTTTNGSTTATVETLVAEVRVLKVGSRQITLSVAKQLDEVPVFELEPFGRIHCGEHWADPVAHAAHDPIQLIGRHITTGALVKAWAWVPKSSAIADPSDTVSVDDYLNVYQPLPLIVLAGLR